MQRKTKENCTESLGVCKMVGYDINMGNNDIAGKQLGIIELMCIYILSVFVMQLCAMVSFDNLSMMLRISVVIFYV